MAVSGGLHGVRSMGCVGGGCVLLLSVVVVSCGGTGVSCRCSVAGSCRWGLKNSFMVSCDSRCFIMLALEALTRRSQRLLTDGLLRSRLLRESDT